MGSSHELVEVPGHVKTTEELARDNPGAAKYVCRRLLRKLAGFGLEDVLVHHRAWGYRYIGRMIEASVAGCGFYERD